MTGGAADLAVQVTGLVKRYDRRAVVAGLTFEVRRGECLALLGPNGAGKTTMVEVLEGYRRADDGHVRVLGLDPARDGAALRARIGLMLQAGGVYPQARPLEILRLYARFYASPRDPDGLLDLVGLRDSATTRVKPVPSCLAQARAISASGSGGSVTTRITASGAELK